MKAQILSFVAYSLAHSSQLYGIKGSLIVFATTAWFAFWAELIAMKTGIIPFSHAVDPLGPLIPGTGTLQIGLPTIC